MIKNVLFDLGNVLFDLDLSRIDTGFRQLMGAPYDQVHDQLLARRFFNLYETGGISTEEFVHTLCHAVEPVLSPESVVAVWNSIFLDFPKARLDMLLQLRQTHSVFLLSNINELHADWIDAYMLRTHGLSDYRALYFDGAYYSHLIRLRKPDADAFEYVLADAEMDPRETVFIDDVPENVAGAEAVGMRALCKSPEVDVAQLIMGYLAGDVR
jgi:putative hydrolase of the HAD superfamily